MENDFHSFRKQIAQVNRQKQDNGALLDYDEAIEIIQGELKEKLGTAMEVNQQTSSKKDEIVIKDKEYLRRKKSTYRQLLTEIIFSKNIRVRGYDGEKTNDFLEEMVGEFAGYSVLENAFADPEISDIYVIDWKTIYVEKGGTNVKYQKTFRSPKHFKDTLERFMREAGKEINLGDKKIVDFELYQDRGCATSPSVSPRDYSLTLRKHAEDHITREQLIGWNVLTEQISDFLGMLIVGECNIIYAGLTGSGKTTTIRALLDHYVTKANKRMLVCEDTQELFPKNDHTLELVSVKSDDKAQAVPLGKLIITALRLKPKYIVVGEVRGEEAEAAVEGMETGHSTIFTMHGGNPWNIVNRLVTKYLMAMPTLGIDVVERIIGSAVDYVAIQDNIPGVGRKITSICEVNYDFTNKRVDIKTIFRYDFRKRFCVRRKNFTR
ncbi:ATPase, T2SS/T4P/T4SS family (plasmid) [Aneurinibacillus sp. Ricciae_BoGa-3]|uniref:CpaF family protein n=1 Tax=Aneurinibacillus sp. Ricciae_BoGa-3 TaxID=3022697 RepID=UPI0023422D4C|nr:ATPase, T2SS/T4P/T4SS family [Aneurinibacillus sp. Ricciae_BoGa-3]WCK56926.1 ATPase, T2SS/T4P/T4SS family [Aneurinibacillus sp. Ricciae_BoGa-3]